MSNCEEKWDIFRGIAILLVVIGHLIESNTAMWNLIYVVHIPTFFLISGYFTFSSVLKYSFKENQIKKAKTLLLPWLTWSTLAVAFVWEYVVSWIRLAHLNKLFIGIDNATMEIYTIYMMFVAYVVLVPGCIAQSPIVYTYLHMPLYVMLICWVIKLLSEKVLQKIPPYNILMLGKGYVDLVFN